MKRLTVQYRRDEDGWWLVRLQGVRGVLTQARSLDQGRRRIRKALALAVGDAAAKKARFVADVRLPSTGMRALASLAKAREEEAGARAEARRLATRAVPALTRFGLSAQDVADLTGYSAAQIQQLKG